MSSSETSVRPQSAEMSDLEPKLLGTSSPDDLQRGLIQHNENLAAKNRSRFHTVEERPLSRESVGDARCRQAARLLRCATHAQSTTACQPKLSSAPDRACLMHRAHFFDCAFADTRPFFILNRLCAQAPL